MHSRSMKILQIAYYFPPMGGAGVQRGLKFSKYLPTFGITPVVLAADDPHYVRDDSLLAEIADGLEIHRVEHSPWLAKIAASRRAKNPMPAGAAVSAALPRSGLRNAVRDIALRSIRATQWPDEAAGWARAALAKARAVVGSHAASGQPIELVFSSSPPASAHWVGERIARVAGLPWVADFRDLWTDNPAYDAPAWRRVLDRRMEDRWLSRASGVITVTPSWKDMLAARRQVGASVAFIPNGYDEDDFRSLATPQRQPNVFTLVHTGTFYGPRDPDGLLRGLAAYLRAARPGHLPLRVRLVGNMGARFSLALQAFDRDHPGVVETVPFLPHKDAVAELMAADALLLVVGGGRGTAVRGWLPGKIFEYLRVGKPILMLGDPDGDAATLVKRHSRGWICNDQDSAAIAQSLAAMLQPPPQPTSDHQAPQPYGVFERRQLTAQLAEYLGECRRRHAS
jgi:glycosyltransferase involved in cell wall biosynthesis